MIAIVNEGKQRLNQSECRLIEFTDIYVYIRCLFDI